jgi:cell division protein FtsL
MTSAVLADGQPEITLHDVIAHMQSMKQELRGDMHRMERKIDSNTMAIRELRSDIRDLHLRVDVLEIDLTSTIKDMLGIRRHVGLGVGEEE